MPRVYSRRKGAKAAPEGAVYVGRPTRWGNPFLIGQDGTREAVVREYREWLLEDTPHRVAYRESIRRELRGKDLVCWCAPKPCHADVLLEIANG